MKFVGGHWNPNEICGWTSENPEKNIQSKPSDPRIRSRTYNPNRPVRKSGNPEIRKKTYNSTGFAWLVVVGVVVVDNPRRGPLWGQLHIRNTNTKVHHVQIYANMYSLQNWLFDFQDLQNIMVRPFRLASVFLEIWHSWIWPHLHAYTFSGLPNTAHGLCRVFKTNYSPMFNCRIYTLIRFSGPEVVIFASKSIHAYWLLALRPSHTRLKRYPPILFSPVLLYIS